MAKYPTRAQLMNSQLEQPRITAVAKEANIELQCEVAKSKEQLTSEVAERDRILEETRRQIQEEEENKREEFRQQIREEMQSLFGQHRKF